MSFESLHKTFFQKVYKTQKHYTIYKTLQNFWFLKSLQQKYKNFTKPTTLQPTLQHF